MAKSFVDQNGVNKLRYKFQEMSKQAAFGTVSTLGEIGKDLLGKSQEIVPYDKGDLERSGYYGIFDGPQGPALEVGYQEPYAIVQHEDLSLNHPGGREAKYLERPFLENKTTYRDWLFDVVRRPGSQRGR